MDNSNIWSSTSDSWVSILKVKNSFPNNTLDETFNISPLSTPKIGLDFRRQTNILSTIKTIPLSSTDNSSKSEASESDKILILQNNNNNI